MSDQVITDEEKDALLSGVETGEVEVHTGGGQIYANVRDFELPPRSRIVSNSYPRLAALNAKLATKATRSLTNLFNTDVTVAANGIDVQAFSVVTRESRGRALLEFSASPLEGPALLEAGADLLGRLVEAFFGGNADNPRHEGADGFTPGEFTVASVFARELLELLKESWEGFESIEPALKGPVINGDVADLMEPTDIVVACTFDIDLLGEPQYFRVLWPLEVLRPLVSALEGSKRDRDSVDDARWEQSIRGSVTASGITLSSTVGEAKLTLRELITLKPGDVLDIDDPRRGVMLAAGVPVLNGRFGLHDGRYAMEATAWIPPQAADQRSSH